MRAKRLVIAALATTAAVLAPSMTYKAQAATFGGNNACAEVSFTYVSCAGFFSGNDKGASGSGLDNLNNLFGEGWSFAGDNESGLVTFLSGGEGTKAGSAKTTLSGAGAIAVKAGNSYALYSVSDLSSFDWSTEGVQKVGSKGKNTLGLSHLSVYRRIEPEAPKKVPEPSMLLGLVAMMGAGARLKKKD